MHRLLLVAVIAVACASGCGGPKMVKVSGRVTLDGKDLPDGEISLVPSDPAQGPDAGKITNGQFEIMAKPGAKKVQIRASRELPPMKDKAMGGIPQFESIIPPRYNDATELTLDVPDGGVAGHHFELKSDKR